MAQPSKRDGTPRKLTDHVMIRMNGTDNEATGVTGNNFAEKCKQYEGEDAWDQLDACANRGARPFVWRT